MMNFPKQKPSIVFIHDGHGMYPLTKALMAAYSDTIDFQTMTFAQASSCNDIKHSICWYIMGHYPKKIHCKKTIHDYRSLSTGRFHRIKDFIKKLTNVHPDIRIIQPSIADKLNFRDDIPTYFMDVSISDEVLKFRSQSTLSPKYDFCYVGAMNAERGIDKMLDNFLKYQPPTSSILMIGHANMELLSKFSKEPNIYFTGVVPQEEVFLRLKDCGVAVSFFPNHYPHTVQTPTKMLEYAGLGMRILANVQSMNRLKGEEYNMHIVWRSEGALFEKLPELCDWPDNYHTDAQPMLFSSHMELSGVRKLLEDELEIQL